MDQSPKPKLRPKLRLSYDDLKKIERVVNEEAKGEGVEGRNAIRGVIFNRLMSDRFPDSVDEVLSPREFEPVGKYGSIDKIPVTEDTLLERLTEMADYIQYGEDASKGSTFFLNKKLAKKRKTDFGGKDGMTIGNHTFYKSYEGQEPVKDINFSHNIEVSYDGYDEGGFVSKFMDMITSPLTGDYRKKKPLSVKAADTAVSLTTPIDSIVDIQAELEKEDPDYLKIGMLGGMEAIGLLGAGAPKAAQAMIRKGADMARQTDEAIDVASSVPKVSRSATPSYTDEALLEADEILFEWGKGNLTNPQLRKAMSDKGFKIETKTISPKMTADDIEVVGPDGNIVRWKDMPRGTGAIDTTKTSVEAAGLTDEAIDAWRKANATSDDFRKSLKGRNQELQDLANKIDDPDSPITVEDYRRRADELRPIRKVTDVPKPATYKETVSALNAGKRKKPMIGLNAEIPDGDVITARLDIDAYTDYDVWVPTLTHPDLKTVYKPTVVLKDVTFIDETSSAVKKAKGVAQGKPKAPFAVMTGKYQNMSNDEAYEYATSVFDSDEWVQAGYDPTKRGFFYDRADGQPIIAGDEVIQIGHLVLVKNAKKGDAKAFGFNEGGMAMDEQMGMMFKSSRGMAMNEGGDIGETVGVDPVSGNEIPLGSTAENVRDDIPAQLSEGEYVVPADVVRYYGVKFFEDLRTEAKIGFQQMQENGRIGGEPVGMEMAGDELPFDISELQMVDDGEEQPMMAAGGYMKGYAPGGFESYSPADYQPGGSIGTGGIEVVKYIHPDGREIFIQFMNGTPLTMIPEGFEKEATAEEQVAEGVTEQVTRNDEPEGRDTPIEAPEPIDWSNDATVEDFQNYADRRGGFGQKALTVGATMVAGLKGSALVHMAQKMEYNNVVSGLKEQIEKTEDPNKKTQLQEILNNLTKDKDEDPKEGKKSGIFGGKSGLFEGLEDTDGNKGATFGDTWLGDLLGFDEDGPGVQGDNLTDSWKGSRRDGKPSDTSTTTNNNNDKPTFAGEGNNNNSSPATAEQIETATQTSQQANSNTDFTPGDDQFDNQVEYDADFYSKGGLVNKKK